MNLIIKYKFVSSSNIINYKFIKGGRGRDIGVSKKYLFWLDIVTQMDGSVKKISWLYQISVSISMNSVIRSYELDKIQSTIKFNEWKLLRRVWPGCGRVKNAFSDLLILTQNIYYSAGSKQLPSIFGAKMILNEAI